MNDIYAAAQSLKSQFGNESWFSSIEVSEPYIFMYIDRLKTRFKFIDFPSEINGFEVKVIKIDIVNGKMLTLK